MVDKFHIKGHVVRWSSMFTPAVIFTFQEKACTLSDPACLYHPDLPKNLPYFGGINTEVDSYFLK